MTKTPILVAPYLDLMDLETFIARLNLMRASLAEMELDTDYQHAPNVHTYTFNRPGSDIVIDYRNDVGNRKSCRLWLRNHPKTRDFMIFEGNLKELPVDAPSVPAPLLAYLDRLAAEACDLLARKHENLRSDGLDPETAAIIGHAETLLAARAVADGFVLDKLRFKSGDPYKTPLSIIVDGRRQNPPRLDSAYLARAETKAIADLLPPIRSLKICDSELTPEYEFGIYEFERPIRAEPSVLDEMKACRALGLDGQAPKKRQAA